MSERPTKIQRTASSAPAAAVQRSPLSTGEGKVEATPSGLSEEEEKMKAEIKVAEKRVQKLKTQKMKDYMANNTRFILNDPGLPPVERLFQVKFGRVKDYLNFVIRGQGMTRIDLLEHGINISYIPEVKSTSPLSKVMNMYLDKNKNEFNLKLKGTYPNVKWIWQFKTPQGPVLSISLNNEQLEEYVRLKRKRVTQQLESKRLFEEKTAEVEARKTRAEQEYKEQMRKIEERRREREEQTLMRSAERRRQIELEEEEEESSTSGSDSDEDEYDNNDFEY